MRMSKYIVSEKRLKKLLAAELKLRHLETGGVDNWSYYGEGREEFLLEAIDGRISEEELPEDIDFDYVAELNLADYEKLEDD